MKKKVFITGGAGYCGSVLVPYLIDAGYFVSVYDMLYFGNFLPKNNKNLYVIKGDIRDSKKILSYCKNHDIFISLACTSNDASFDLDEDLSTSVNLDAFEPMVLAAKVAGIKRFIYASSSSVYGVSSKKNVTEDHPLVPLTLYNKYKGMCEPILNQHANEEFEVVTFRPATVCGYSPRLRLDLSVNILTNHAITNSIIKVFGGDQLRPNLHIIDYCKAIKVLMEAPKSKIFKECFNVGYQNLSILDIANLVKKIVEKEFPEKKPISIIRTLSDDNRSYHINSDKIKRILNFSPTLTIENAIEDLCHAFKKKLIQNSMENSIYYNVKRYKLLKIK